MKKKAVIIGLLIISAIIVCNSCGIFKNIALDDIKNYIASFGAFAPLAYIIMFTLVPLTLFPDALLALAGGVLFGVYWGTLYTIIGATFGGTLSFYISRLLGRNIVEKLVRHKAQWFDDGVEKRGFLVILLLRLIPLVPFDIISYGAGLSKIRYMDFVTATAIGIIPGVLIYTNLGDKAINIYSVEFVCAVCALILLCGMSFVLKKKFSFEKIQSNVIIEQVKEQHQV